MNKNTNQEIKKESGIEARIPELCLRKGRTAFFISLYFNEKSKENFEEKVKKLMKKNIENGDTYGNYRL